MSAPANLWLTAAKQLRREARQKTFQALFFISGPELGPPPHRSAVFELLFPAMAAKRPGLASAVRTNREWAPSRISPAAARPSTSIAPRGRTPRISSTMSSSCSPRSRLPHCERRSPHEWNGPASPFPAGRLRTIREGAAGRSNPCRRRGGRELARSYSIPKRRSTRRDRRRAALGDSPHSPSPPP